MRRLSPRQVTTALAVAATAAPIAVLAPAAAVSDQAHQPALAYAGESTLAAGLTFQSTVVGGLSSITYDAARDVYYALSDAQGTPAQGPVRFYTLDVDVSDGRLDPGDVTVLGVTLLTDAAGVPLQAGSVDPEGLTLTTDDTLIMTSEGFAATRVAPFVREFSLAGRQLREIDLPSYVDPGVDEKGLPTGVRQNLGLESAAVTPDGQHLLTGMENALAQDGPLSTASTTSASRLLDVDLRHGDVEHEYVYRDEAVVEPPAPGAFSVNGLVELLPFNRRSGLSMERSFTVGGRNTIRLFRYATAGADDVAGVDDLDAPSTGPVREVDKTLVLDLDELVKKQGLVLDNIEGLTRGPRLPDGGRAVLVVSDNNFTPGQVSQFLLFSAHGVGPSA